MAKWHSLNNTNINQFLDYFKMQWLNEKIIGWYESYAEGYPSTNNAIEATNGVIKREHTYGEEFPLQLFLEQCFKPILSKWSEERDPSKTISKLFAMQPSFDTPDFTNAYKWVALKKRIIKINYIGKEF